MKLLYIANTLSGAGGLQRILLLKAGYLAEHMGYNITIITTSNKPDEKIFYPVSLKLKGITLTPDKSNKLSYLTSYVKFLSNSINALNPDVVIICDNGLKSFLLPFILNKKFKLVYERHVTKFIENKAKTFRLLSATFNKLVYKFMDFSAAKFDKFLVVTQQGKNEWGIKNLAAIPNPLWFSTNVVSNLSNKRVIAVGRHAYEKGYDRMVTAWKQVVDKHPEWVLDIYGDDNPEYNIRQLAHDAGVDKNVNFITSTKHIIDAYLESSICIMTSRYEGFGMVLLEAMACGVPCVAFNCPVGPSDIISNNIDGVLVEDGNIEEFVKSVLLLIENPALRLEMGANAKVSSEDYDIDVIMKEWDTLFRSLFQRAEIA
jgi:glycosyltransferase involved in cell wall biosynthesis